MPQRDFDTLFAIHESNLAFANETAILNELKASVKTVEQCARLAKLYCDSVEKIYTLVQDCFPICEK